MRYFIELSYLGTNFHGWQVQPNAHSVQQEIESALSTLLNCPTSIVGAGRTDTGVHASFYIAHFDTDQVDKVNKDSFVYHLNAILCDDVSVKKIYAVTDDAHARFSALTREYKYYISRAKNPFYKELSYRYTQPLNIEAMNKAAELIPKYKDFTSFAKLHSDTTNNLCDVHFAKFEQKDDMLVFTISANRFLRNMVRAIVGTLLDVGREKITIEKFISIIESQNRCAASSSAHPAGLFLTDITYPENIKAEIVIK